MITDYHAKYYAYELTRRRRGSDVDRLSQSLFNSSVDLNPHQIDAALFALQNPLTKGVLMADEVGLGKTIEAALVISQLWAERKRNIIIICPASLRKQWANELTEKFNLPVRVLDAKTYKMLQKKGIHSPLREDVINIISFNYVTSIEKHLTLIPWDLVVIDEAHKLRNAHRESHQTGQAVKRTFAGSKKLLLTATPLQNSLLELFGLSTIIDEHLFGDITSFRSQFMRDGNDIEALKYRLKEFCQRTLRRHVLEYIKYTKRIAVTIPFTPSPEEVRFYNLISAFLQRENSYALPYRQKHLVSLVVRKLLASSTAAVIKTLEGMLERLNKLLEDQEIEDDWIERLIDDEDLEYQLEGDFEQELQQVADQEKAQEQAPKIEVDMTLLKGEIAELEQYLELAYNIKEDEKSHALCKALDIGFEKMQKMGSPRKAVIFTESTRTQAYLAQYLERHGYNGKVITFSGSNNTQTQKAVYQNWIKENKGTYKVTGSLAIDKRSAIIDNFKDDAEILVATEAAAEGVNLQFCNLVVNYDLPWNPQRVEQRIGRCHRYGQKFDVVVINFLNKKNEADGRVLEILTDKFQLFDGLFGSSDEILGRIESGIDFEKRIIAIYDQCRTPTEINTAFDELQKELDETITKRMAETEAKLFENFDQQIHELLKIRKQKAEERLDIISRLFWQLTQHLLAQLAQFDSDKLIFDLAKSIETSPAGRYRLKHKGVDNTKDAVIYRMNHPLGEYVLDKGRRLNTPVAKVVFDLSNHSYKLSALESLSTKSGWLELTQLELKSFQDEEHLVFTAQTDTGELLDQELCEQLFNLFATTQGSVSDEPPETLKDNAKQQIKAKLNQALEENNKYFEQAREKLEAWAEDQILSSEKSLEDTKLKIRDAKRQSRQAQSLEEQKEWQIKIKKLEKQKRNQRREIFDVEDAIEEKRDELIAGLEKRLMQKTSTHHLFLIRWHIT